MAMHWLRSTIWFMRLASSLCSILWSAAASLTAASGSRLGFLLLSQAALAQPPPAPSVLRNFWLAGKCSNWVSIA